MKNYYTFLFSFLFSVCFGQVFEPQKNKVTDKFFKEMDVEIQTPAFSKKKGFTKYDEMMDFLNGLQSKNSDKMQIKFIGESQKGKHIPLVIINKNPNPGKIKFWIQAGIHGNEPASSEGILYLIQQLLENPSYEDLLHHLEIGIIPMANIDGYEKQERRSANGMDLNRDQTKLLAPESVVLKQAFSDFNADVAMDFHEFNPFRTEYLNMGKAGYTVPYDVMLLYTGNLNVDEDLRNYTENIFIKGTQSFLQSKNLTSHDYFSTSSDKGYTVYNVGSINPRASATSYALANAISTLVEVRGVGLDRTSFKRRIMTTFYTAISYMELAVQHKSELQTLLSKTHAKSAEKVVVTSNSKASEEDFPFIDLGKNETVNQKVSVRNALRSEAVITRSFPNAYIMDARLKHAVEKLKVLGLKVTTLPTPQTLTVEKYTVKEYSKSASISEGTYPQNVTATTEKITKQFPAGTFIIWTDQKNKALLFETLEPEARNSFFAFGIVETNLGEELPIYRYLDSKF